MEPGIQISELKNADDIAKKLPNRYRYLVRHLPESVHYSAVTWVWFGVDLGGDFFTALINNDLVRAFSRADSSNVLLMESYARWLYNDAPSSSWGSKETIAAWSKAGGLLGLADSETITDYERG